MKKRFEPALAEETWDAVIVGSGPGSLTAAAILAKAGRRVLVLERHYEPGGFSHTFKRKGYEWDVGVHYIGGVHREGGLERRLFDYLTGGRLEWGGMGEPYDRAIIDGEVYDFVPGAQHQLDVWAGYFPEEEQAIRTYWGMVRDCARSARSFFAERAVPPLIGAVAGPFMKHAFGKYAARTTYDLLRDLTDNERLITVLCAQCGDYGLPPKDSSFAIHAMVANHYRDGGNYPTGGAANIANGMIATIEEHGGVVAVRSPVDDILVEHGKAAGVRLESGETVRADTVISGAGVRNTFQRMLPKGVAPPARIRKDLDRVGPSMAHLCLYLGLDQSDAELGLPKFNYWCYDPYTGDGEPGGRIPAAYISFQSAKDRAWAKEHAGTAAVQCIGFGRFEDFADWSGTRWRRRPEDYEAAKAAFQDRMLGLLFDLQPQVQGRVAWAEVSTPLSTAHFAGYAHGEIYGLEHTPDRFALKWLRPRTFLPNLYLTGQDVVTCGVAGAVMSGVLTASALLKRNAVEMILRGD